MSWRSIKLASILATTLSASALASGPDGKFANLGPGTDSCGRWTQDRKGHTSGLDNGAVSWILGFVTAYNRYMWKQPDGDVTGTTDNAGLLAWVDNYCAANPLDTVARAAQELITDLANRAAPPTK